MYRYNMVCNTGRVSRVVYTSSFAFHRNSYFCYVKIASSNQLGRLARHRPSELVFFRGPFLSVPLAFTTHSFEVTNVANKYQLFIVHIGPRSTRPTGSNSERKRSISDVRR